METNSARTIRAKQTSNIHASGKPESCTLQLSRGNARSIRARAKFPHLRKSAKVLRLCVPSNFDRPGLWSITDEVAPHPRRSRTERYERTDPLEGPLQAGTGPLQGNTRKSKRHNLPQAPHGSSHKLGRAVALAKSRSDLEASLNRRRARRAARVLSTPGIGRAWRPGG